MHRFFIPPDWIQDNIVTVTGPQARQISRVLRMRPGDELLVLDNSGWEVQTRLLSVERDTVRGEVLRKFEYVLQKCTELGVVEFVPLITERCVISDLNTAETKLGRWRWIIQEAAEQSRRGRLPSLRPSMLFPQACDQARQRGGLALAPWEEEGQISLRQVLRTAPEGHEKSWPPLTISLFIGPEGGFSAAEVELARRYGPHPCRALRCLQSRSWRASWTADVTSEGRGCGDLRPVPGPVGPRRAHKLDILLGIGYTLFT